jgi:GNAT superfamily N-acetyltransferase
MSFSIRPASSEDAPTIARHRTQMFCEMGEISGEQQQRQLLEASLIATGAAISDGSYQGWLAIDDNDIVLGGAGVHIKAQMPRPDLGGGVASCDVPLVINVYTEPAWRGCGVARTLMLHVQDWARAQRFDRVVLHASLMGRPLYERLGFKNTNEMRWDVEIGE